MNKCLVGKLETHNVETVAKLFSLTDKCAREVEAQSRTECCNMPKELASPKCVKLSDQKNKCKAVATTTMEGRKKLPSGHGSIDGVSTRSTKPTAMTSLSVDW